MEQGVKVQGADQAPAQKYCAQCGTPAWLEARFCQSCGLDLVAATPGAQSQLGADTGSMTSGQDMAPEAGKSGMSLETAWMIYTVAMLVWIGTLVLPVGPFFLPIYLVSGFVMTRFVMRGVIEFHPVYNTVQNVFSAKLWMFLLWPLQMGILLFKLTFNSTM